MKRDEKQIRTIEGINTAGWPHKEVSRLEATGSAFCQSLLLSTYLQLFIDDDNYLKGFFWKAFEDLHVKQLDLSPKGPLL